MSQGRGLLCNDFQSFHQNWRIKLVAARSEIAKLQRVLSKKTMENKLLKDAVEYAAEDKRIARAPLLPGESQ